MFIYLLLVVNFFGFDVMCFLFDRCVVGKVVFREDGFWVVKFEL